MRRIFEIATGFNLANIFDSVVSGAIRAGTALVKLGLDTQRQEEAFDRMTKSLGVRGDALAMALEKASRGMADASDIMTQSAVSLQEGFKPETLISLMELAADRSRLMGVSVAEAYNKINAALVAGQERGLRSAQIFIDSTAVLEDYARANNRTVASITDMQKSQLLADEAIRKYAQSTKAAKDATLTNLQEVQKLTVAWQNFTENLGKNLADAGAAITKWALRAGEAVRGFADQIANARKAVEEFFLSRKDTLIGGLVAPLIEAGVAAREVVPPMKAGADAVEQLGTNSAAAGPKFRTTAEELKKAAAEAERAAKSLAGFQGKVIDAAIVDETARAIVGIRRDIAEASKEFPQNAARLAVFGKALEDMAVQARMNADAMKELGEVWTATLDPLSDGAERATLAIGAFEVKLSTTGLGEAYRRSLQDVQFGLEGVGGATVDIVDVQDQARESVEDLGDAFAQLPILDTSQRIAALTGLLAELRRNGVEPASEAVKVLGAELESALRVSVGDQLAAAGLQARILGNDFDFAGARIAILRGQFDALVKASQGEWTPEIQRVGDELRASLADQSLYRSIEQGFLSITDTFTKMADGLIQGTLDIGDAFANLGRNLLTNFVQIVLHQVFDPILREAASFVSGLIGLLTGRGGGGGLAAAGGILGGVLGGFGGGNNFSTAQFAAIAQGGSAGGGGGTIDTLGTAASVLGTAYSGVSWVLSQLGIVQLPTLTSALTSLATAVGLMGPTISEATFAAIGLAAVGGESAAVGSAAGAAAGAASAGAGLSALPLLGATLPALIVGVGVMLQAQSRAEKRWRELNEQRQAFAMTQDVTAGLAGLTLQNAMEQPRKKFLEELKFFAEFSAIAPEQREQRRQAGTLTAADIPGSAYTSEGQLPDLSTIGPFDQSPVLQEAKSLINSLTKLGIDASHLWAQTSKELGSTTLFQNFDQWNKLVVAYAKSFETLMGTGSGAEKSVEQLRIEALMTAESLDTIAEVLGVARQAIPDFTNAVESEIPAMLATMKKDLTDSFLAEPVKIAGLLDLGSLQREGEDVQDTLQRMATALQGLGSAMERLDDEAEQLRGTLDIPAQYARAMGKIAEAMSAAQGVLTSTRDPEQMLAAEQQLEELIKARYKLEIDTANALLGKYRELAGVVTASIGAFANAADTLDQLGIDLTGMTTKSAAFVFGLDDAMTKLAALPALMASAFAEAGQIARASGSLSAGLDVILSEPLAALWDTFHDVMGILDPSARASALQGFLGQIDSFFQQAVTGIKTYYAAARAEAEKLASEFIEDIRAAAAEQIKPLEAQKELAQQGLAAIQEQRDAIQEYIAGIREALAIQVDALNAQKEGIQEQIDAIRDALQVRVDALNEEKDALQDILQTAQEAARVAQSLRAAITDLRIGDLAPPDAQAQFAAARSAFETAAPGDAGAAGKRLLEVALSTGLYTRPDPEFRALNEEVIARLGGMAELAESQASPAEQAAERLKSIDAEIKDLNTQATAALKPLEGALKSIDAEIKSLNKQAEALIKPLEATLKSLDKQTADLNKSIAALDKSIAGINKQADTDVKAVEQKRDEFLKQLSVDEQAAIDRVKDTLAPIAWATVQAVADNTSTVLEQNRLTGLALTDITGSRTAEEFTALRTWEMAGDLSRLSGNIHTSLQTLVADRLDDLLDLPGGSSGIKDALSTTEQSLGKVVSNTFATGWNVAELTRLVTKGPTLYYPSFPSAQFGMRDTGQGGLVLTHARERILSAAEKLEYESGERGATATLTINVDARGAADISATGRAVRDAVRAAWDGWLRAQVIDTMKRRS